MIDQCISKEAVQQDLLDFSSSPQEHGNFAMDKGGALDFDLGGDCPFSTIFGAGVTPVSTFTIDAPYKPPPSYWIGLSRPPPAPNWQRFAIERARTRPPPAPNWYAFFRPPPAPSWQNHHYSSLPPTPPKSTTFRQLQTILCPIPAPLPLGSCGSKIPSVSFVLWKLNLLGFIGCTFLELIFFGDTLFGVTLFGVISNGGSLTVNQQCPFPVFNWFC
jgi:hypothetical protein